MSEKNGEYFKNSQHHLFFFLFAARCSSWCRDYRDIRNIQLSCPKNFLFFSFCLVKNGQREPSLIPNDECGTRSSSRGLFRDPLSLPPLWARC
jgi:hypothetical protein